MRFGRGEVNSTGDDLKKLVILSTDMTISALVNSGVCCLLGKFFLCTHYLIVALPMFGVQANNQLRVRKVQKFIASSCMIIANVLNMAAMVPILPMDNLLLTFPLGAAVMKSLGVSSEEVNAIVESKRTEVLQIRCSNRELEELKLLQLGISASTMSNPTDAAVVSEETLDDGERYEMTAGAAYERRKAVEGRSSCGSCDRAR